jgi:hypothetical protein
MRGTKGVTTLPAVVVAAVLAAVGLSLYAWWSLSAGRARFQRLLGELAALEAMDAELDASRAAQAAFNGLAAQRAVPLDELIARVLPGCRADRGREVREDVEGGWVLRQQEVGLSEVPFGKAMELVEAAASQRPPWRLVKCTLRASPREPGVGQAVLEFEALEFVAGGGDAGNGSP